MASQAPKSTASQVNIPQHYLPPTTRELRAQGVQRLQVGLFGLAAMLLLVGLANIILDRAHLAEVAAGTLPATSASASHAAEGSDPLVDIGVMPGAEATAAPSPRASGAPRN